MSQRRLPAGIYWRRRLLLLAVLIALVWAVMQVIGGGDDGTPKARPTVTSSPSAVATPAPVATTNGVVDVILKSSGAPCNPEKVRITPSVRPGQVTKGPVDIGLVVSSSDLAACTLTPVVADLVAVISANGTPIWDSTVCKVSLLADPVAISPRWATLVTVQWTGRGSGTKCSGKEGFATPGKYTVQLGTLGGEPGKTTFTLDPKPDAAPTPAAPTPAAPTTAPAVTPAPPKGTTKPADQ